MSAQHLLLSLEVGKEKVMIHIDRKQAAPFDMVERSLSEHKHVMCQCLCVCLSHTHTHTHKTELYVPISVCTAVSR